MYIPASILNDYGVSKDQFSQHGHFLQNFLSLLSTHGFYEQHTEAYVGLSIVEVLVLVYGGPTLQSATRLLSPPATLA